MKWRNDVKKSIMTIIKFLYQYCGQYWYSSIVVTS